MLRRETTGRKEWVTITIGLERRKPNSSFCLQSASFKTNLLHFKKKVGVGYGESKPPEEFGPHILPSVGPPQSSPELSQLAPLLDLAATDDTTTHGTIQPNPVDSPSPPAEAAPTPRETEIYILRECPNARVTWRFLEVQGMKYLALDAYLNTWIEANVKGGNNDPKWAMKFLTTIWYLWK
ncbi:hypothetical protein Cgig2_002285 [Carnegiea gigantea]|uniref:Uncharacterized protein n=1 Tax=Carnegiea gigantea TaxID=171969 RepID=A0A9Q1QNP8_9CARY|nr:hypothetical protein Cgig2_002285 [Carnegiea gigantea]